MPRPAWRLPRVLAHRCGGKLAPENTLAGLTVAVAHGCGGVEFDVMLSAAQTPFVIHDETLERTTSGQGRVAETDDAILRGLDAGRWFDMRFAGERIPTLEEVATRTIELGLAVNLEIKPSSGQDELTARVVAQQALSLWRDAGPMLLLSSFSERALIVAQEVAPEVPRGLLFEAIPDDWRQRCLRLGAISLHAEAEALNRTIVQAVRAAGLRLVAYTVNDPVRATALFEWGVDCVITDRPDLVRSPLSIQK